MHASLGSSSTMYGTGWLAWWVSLPHVSSSNEGVLGLGGRLHSTECCSQSRELVDGTRIAPTQRQSQQHSQRKVLRPNIELEAPSSGPRAPPLAVSATRTDWSARPPSPRWPSPSPSPSPCSDIPTLPIRPTHPCCTDPNMSDTHYHSVVIPLCRFVDPLLHPPVPVPFPFPPPLPPPPAVQSLSPMVYL